MNKVPVFVPGPMSCVRVCNFDVALFLSLLVVCLLAMTAEPSLPNPIHTVAATLDTWTPHTLKITHTQKS